MGSTIAKHIVFGALIGGLANALGVLSFCATFLKGSCIDNLYLAYDKGELGKIIFLGAIFNLIVFFLFMYFKKYYIARGILLITFVVAFIILALNFN